MIPKILKFVGNDVVVGTLRKVFGALQDPVTGNLSLSRSSGAAVLALGAEMLASEPIAGALVIIAGAAMIIARTKSTEGS